MKRRKRVAAEQSTNIENPDTLYIEGSFIQKRYRQMVERLGPFLQKMHEGKLVFNYGEKTCPTKPADLLRVLSEWSQKDLVDLTIRNIIVDTILSSENKQIGSGVICALSLLDALHEDTKLLSKRAEVDNLFYSIDYMLGKGILSEIVKKSIEVGTLGASISIDVSHNRHFIIESDTVVKILGSIHPVFENPPTKKIENPVIVCVDGIIESLGEIDGLLQEAAENKTNVIICASGYHPDVVHTLYQNWKEKRLNVFPFAVAYWDPSLKLTTLEVCSKLGLDCVSPETGGVLASKKLENFSSIKSSYFSKNNLSLCLDDGDEIFLQIKIPSYLENMLGVIEDRIRIAVNNCISIANSGVAKDTSIELQAKKLGIPYPAVSLKAHQVGIKTAENCKLMIESLGGAVIPEIK